MNDNVRESAVPSQNLPCAVRRTAVIGSFALLVGMHAAKSRSFPGLPLDIMLLIIDEILVTTISLVAEYALEAFLSPGFFDMVSGHR